MISETLHILICALLRLGRGGEPALSEQKKAS